jgi:hypothetical protein
MTEFQSTFTQTTLNFLPELHFNTSEIATVATMDTVYMADVYALIYILVTNVILL